MKFDVVVGNPPYNNDVYLDFVEKGCQMSKAYSLWITPAKVNKLGTMKKYISDVVLFPCEGDIFTITMPCGIAYYLIGKSEVDTVNVANKSDNFTLFNSSTVFYSLDYATFNIVCQSILDRLGDFESFCPELYKNTSDNYKCFVLKQVYTIGGSNNRHRGIFYADNMFNSGFVLHNCDIQSGIRVNKLCIFSSNCKQECESFKSWYNTKLIRFLVLCGLNGYGNAYLDEYWRFVPAPEAFDHIFTDEELYKKYNLSSEEINIIESVIRERK